APFAANAASEWSYEGETVPQAWGDISEAYEVCKSGMMQSPIDLAEANAVGEVELSVHYVPSPLMILNNGHTVQANFAAGSTMKSGETVFPLVQVHFHTPSEHIVGDKVYPLVAHFVHATADGKLGVLGILFEEGEANAELQKLVEAAPAEKADVSEVEGVSLDPNGLLPQDLSVYRYMGSLTTPPCSEGVNWHVVKAPVSASAEQIAALEEIMGMNARPVLPLNNRLLVAPGQ
ncbi:MAG: carbonic anhydrase family protein, partial [Alphaproteobacteria bacterium]|nr:carbonic anhydrase family protein [Alphaproteobacteria bacterium]